MGRLHDVDGGDTEAPVKLVTSKMKNLIMFFIFLLSLLVLVSSCWDNSRDSIFSINPHENSGDTIDSNNSTNEEQTALGIASNDSPPSLDTSITHFIEGMKSCLELRDTELLFDQFVSYPLYVDCYVNWTAAGFLSKSEFEQNRNLIIPDSILSKLLEEFKGFQNDNLPELIGDSLLVVPVSFQMEGQRRFLLFQFKQKNDWKLSEIFCVRRDS